MGIGSKSRLMDLCWSIFLVLAVFLLYVSSDNKVYAASSSADKKARKTVEIEEPLTEKEITLTEDEPAPYVLLKGWYCNPERFIEQTLLVTKFFEWAKAQIVPSDGKNPPKWRADVYFSPEITRTYKLYLKGMLPITVPHVLEAARKMTILKGKYYAPGTGKSNERIPGIRAFWGISEKTTADFIADAPLGEERVKVLRCYSEDDLKNLMELQRKAAMEFIKAAEMKR